MGVLAPDPRGYGIDAVALRMSLAEDTPWRRTRMGTAWADELRSFADSALKIIDDEGGVLTEAGQTGFSVHFDAFRAGSAMNCAIRVHEWLRRRHDSPYLSHLEVRSGLAEGLAFLSSAGASWVLLGSSIERALDLAAYAPNWAILVDTKVLQDPAALDAVKSEEGMRSHRIGPDYLGPVMQLKQDEHRVPISFHQLRWSERLFEEKRSSAVSGGPRDRLRGRVERWDTNRQHGFLLSVEGEWFYADSRFTVDGLDLDVGEEVFFIARPPLQPGKNRVAGAILATGHSVDGTVVNMPAGEPFGFVAVLDSMGTEQHVMMRKEDNNVWPIAVGKDVGFVVGENAQGALATSTAPLGEFVERPDNPRVSLRSMLREFDESLSRLEDRRPGSEPAFGPLFETINWAIALDERIASDWLPEGRPLGPAWHKRVDGAELLPVLRLLRNRLAHQWSDALVVGPAPVTPGGVDWIWRPMAEIKPGRTDPTAERVHREHFAGKRVADVLHRIRAPLAHVVAFMEPAPIWE